MTPALSAESITAQMKAQDIAVEIIQQTVSTNLDLLNRIKAEQIAGNTLLLAVNQTGGRGRKRHGPRYDDRCVHHPGASGPLRF